MYRGLRFAADEAAATTTEYAILVVLITGAVVLAGEGLSMVARPVFQSTGVALNNGNTPRSAGSGDVQEDAAPAEVGSAGITIGLNSLAWIVVLSAAGVAGYGRLRSRRAQQRVTEVELNTAAEEELPQNPSFRKRQDILRALLHHLDGALSRITVDRVMSTKVRTVSPTVPMTDVREVMQQQGFRHLLVVQGAELQGVISDRDLSGRTGKAAKDIMTKKPHTITPDSQVSQAITMMLHGHYSCLPVVEKSGVLRGILTTSDLMVTLQCLMRLLEQHESLSSVPGQEPGQDESPALKVTCA